MPGIKRGIMVERLPPIDDKAIDDREIVRKSTNNDFASPVIGSRIQALRQSGDIDIRDIAKRLNLNKKQLMEVEEGALVADVRMLLLLCDIYSVDANYFFQDLNGISNDGKYTDLKPHQTKDLKRLFNAYLSLSDRMLQKSLVDLAESVGASVNK